MVQNKNLTKSVVNFESLGLEFELPGKIKYNYDGEVDDIRAYSLRRSYESKGIPGYFSTLYDFIKRPRSFAGIYIVSGTYPDLEINTAIRTGMSDLLKTHAKGHEETHALQHIGQTRVLFWILEPNGFIENMYNYKIRDEEVLANIGGNLAVFKKFGQRGLDDLCFTHPNVSILKRQIKNE